MLSYLTGPVGMVTRPTYLFIPASGESTLLVHHVDAGKFRQVGIPLKVYRSREEMVASLRTLVSSGGTVAMEYSLMGALPRASRVDAGVVELVEGLGVEVVSLADMLQYATQRWSQSQLESHKRAADKLARIVLEAFQYISYNGTMGVSEYDVAQFIRKRFDAEGLTSHDGPVVAVNQHCGDPHYEPAQEGSSPIGEGDWVLIDLWAKEKTEDAVYADITWVGFVGETVPSKYQEVFEIVRGARDKALQYLVDAAQQGTVLQGWQVDQVAREYIRERGYGEFFTHRLGHSIGQQVHGRQ